MNEMQAGHSEHLNEAVTQILVARSHFHSPPPSPLRRAVTDRRHRRRSASCQVTQTNRAASHERVPMEAESLEKRRGEGPPTHRPIVAHSFANSN